MFVKNSTRLAAISLLCAIFLNVQPVWAWGALGHQAICDATWRMSSATIKQKLGSAAKRMGYGTFAEACVWADHIRGQNQYDWLKPLHYVNVPRSAVSVEQANCYQSDASKPDASKPDASKPECILGAIEFFVQGLGNEAFTQRQRDEALLLLGHFAGDVHQPLHVSYADDRGGTRRNIVFEGRLMPLHRLWDIDILNCGFRGSWRRLGKSIATDKAVSEDKRKKSAESPSFSKPVNSRPVKIRLRKWADESLMITRDLYRELDQKLSQEQRESLGGNYCRNYHPVAKKRLSKAAMRLAIILDQYL